MAGTRQKVVFLKSPVASPATGNNTATETKLPKEQAAVRGVPKSVSGDSSRTFLREGKGFLHRT